MFTRKLRNEFCSIGSYHETKGHAIAAYDDKLAPAGLSLGMVDMPNDIGHASVPVMHAEATVGYAYVAWYRMPSGRYEITGYLVV